jgi:hypothetical protein
MMHQYRNICWFTQSRTYLFPIHSTIKVINNKESITGGVLVLNKNKLLNLKFLIKNQSNYIHMVQFLVKL